MKQKNSTSTLLALFTAFLGMSTLASCSVVGGIFKAGAWTGIIVVVLVIALIIFIISRLGGGKS